MIIMSTKNPKTINDHFDQKYGKKDSETRLKFEQKAEAYRIAELVKNVVKKHD